MIHRASWRGRPESPAASQRPRPTDPAAAPHAGAPSEAASPERPQHDLLANKRARPGRRSPGAASAGATTCTRSPGSETSPGERILTRDFISVWTASLAGFFSFYLIQQPTLPLYVQHLGGSAAEIGWVGGAFSITTILARPFVGRTVDAVGRRVVIIAGGLIFLVCAPLYAVASTIPLLLALRMVHGAGMAVFTTGTTTYATDLAPDLRRAEAISYYGIASNLALGVGPLAASVLLAFHVSFRAVFFIAAAVALVTVAVMLQAGESPHHRVRRSGWTVDTLFNRRALAPAALLFSASYTYGALVTFIAVSTLRAHLGKDAVAWFWLAYACALIPVRLIGGRVADKLSRTASIVPGLLMLSASMFMVAAVHGLMLLIVSAVLYGGGFALVYPALLALTVDRVGATARGTAMATFSLSLDAGTGIGAVVSGMLAQAIGFTPMYVLAAVAPLAGLAGFAVLLRRWRRAEAAAELAAGQDAAQ
jgi:MFS family permease